MKTRLSLFVVLALASQLLLSCVASGTTAVVGAYPAPYYGSYYGPRYYQRPYYRPRTVIVDRPAVIVQPRPRYYNTPAPRPNYYNYNVQPHRAIRVR